MQKGNKMKEHIKAIENSKRNLKMNFHAWLKNPQSTSLPLASFVIIIARREET